MDPDIVFLALVLLLFLCQFCWSTAMLIREFSNRNDSFLFRVLYIGGVLLFFIGQAFLLEGKTGVSYFGPVFHIAVQFMAFVIGFHFSYWISQRFFLIRRMYIYWGRMAFLAIAFGIVISNSLQFLFGFVEKLNLLGSGG